MNSKQAEPLLREIVEDLASQSLLGSFVENLKDKDMSAFEWWETYLAWSEVGTKEDMERYYDTE